MIPEKNKTRGIVWGRDLVGYRVKYDPLRVISYSDSSYAGDIDNWKSIIGYNFFLKGVITTWCSKCQQTVLTSTSDA